MANVRDEAICIRRWDFSETSQTVSLLGRDLGVLRGIAKGAKREKGSFSGGIELLTRGEVLAIVKKGRDLATLTDWSLLEIFPALAARLDAHRAGLYLADLAGHMLHEGDPHPRLYDELLAALRGLEDPANAADAVLRFQWALLVETGYQPILDRDARTGAALGDEDGAAAFSAEAGGTVNIHGNGGQWRVRTATIELLRRLERGEATEPQESRHSTEALEEHAAIAGRANRLLAAYLRHLMGRELPTMRHFLGVIDPR